MANKNCSAWQKIMIKIVRFIQRIFIGFQRMDRGKRMGLQIGILALVGGVVIGNITGKASATKAAEKKTQEAVAKAKSAGAVNTTQEQEPKETTVVEIPWNLQLVNESYPMAQGFVPELTKTDTYSVDTRIAEATAQMLEAAKAEGMNMVICSSYRSVDKQTQVFNTTVSDHLAGGTDYVSAFATTKQSVAMPGTSEHAMGLALDIVSAEYGELDEKQAETKEAKWLEENCYKYGFILRYPPDKIEETGIIYEPWHYRYVGKEDAEKIMKSGVTLETYMRENYNVQ